MSERLCHHQIGPVHVEHRPGCVFAQCVSCPALLSGWIGGGTDDAHALELRGVTEDVKDHLDRFHPDIDLAAAWVLRVCAWRTVGLTAAVAPG